MFIPRQISTKIQHLLDWFPVVILTGARQTGKTTLLKKMFPKYRYVSLDLPSEAENAENNPEEFLGKHGTPLIVDEIQYAPGLFRHLKYEVDKLSDKNGRFILTGSQKFPLMKQVSDSLAGRCAVLELENLSFLELNKAKKIEESRKDLLKLMVYGQFPKIWKEPVFPLHDFYSSYLATYLERDVRHMMNVTSLRNFERFMRILASRSGNLLNKTEVAGKVGVSTKAVDDWLSILEASGQIVLLEPWFSNFGKRIVKTPKLYFSDTGLLCFLLGLDEQSLLTSPFLGALWETFVFAELRKHVRSLEKPTNLWFYRDQRAREVDFLREEGGIIDFLECKWTELPKASDAGTARQIMKELENSQQPWKPGESFILAPVSSSWNLSEGTRVTGPGSFVSLRTPSSPPRTSPS